MNQVNLVKMANQIGAFFEAMPDRERALRGISNHIVATWEPRMIRALHDHIDAGRATELSDVVRQALVAFPLPHADA